MPQGSYDFPPDVRHGYLSRNLTSASEAVRTALTHLHTRDTIDCHPRVRAAIRLLVDADADISYAYHTITKRYADAEPSTSLAEPPE